MADTLKDILIRQTDYYLTNDQVTLSRPNKVVKTLNAVSLFPSLDGKKRAQTYLKKVISQFNEKELLLRVYEDARKKNGILSSSHRYKCRLLEGICEYLNCLDQLSLYESYPDLSSDQKNIVLLTVIGVKIDELKKQEKKTYNEIIEPPVEIMYSKPIR